MQRNLPPFRADHVGSLLRPPQLKEARAGRASGAIPAEALRAVEDRSIQDLIAKQEAVGLQSITDGEFRRAWWHLDFLERLEGVESYEAAQGIQFKGGQTKPRALRVTGKIGFTGHPFLEHFQFVKRNTKRTAKMTIPSPSVVHYRGGRASISTSVYPTLDAFYHDLGQAYKAAVTAFGDRKSVV